MKALECRCRYQGRRKMEVSPAKTSERNETIFPLAISYGVRSIGILQPLFVMSQGYHIIIRYSHRVHLRIARPNGEAPCSVRTVRRASAYGSRRRVR